MDLLRDYEIRKFEINTAPIFDGFLYGFTDFYNKQIYINSKLSVTEARKTIIHEFVHALKDKYGIKDIEQETTKQAKEIYNLLYSNYVDNIYIIGEKNGE